MRCIARGCLASPAKSGRDLYGSLSLILGINAEQAGIARRDADRATAIGAKRQIADAGGER